MKANYERALKAVLVHEGGYVNHPKDPGGATMKGVTQAVYDHYRDSKSAGRQTVRAITDDELQAIYRSQYWNAIKGDLLPAGLDYAVFDLAVNSGVSRAARFLQAVVGAAQDGLIGPATIAKIGNPTNVIDALCDKRQAFLETLGTFGTFGKGWTTRVKGVRALAKEMAS